MEKRIPHYSLADIQTRVIEQGIMSFTATAIFNAAAMGLSAEQAIQVVGSLNRSMFYKSMTTHADNSIWQDVYHVPCTVAVLYVKFTTDVEGYLVISFKEK